MVAGAQQHRDGAGPLAQHLSRLGVLLRGSVVGDVAGHHHHVDRRVQSRQVTEDPAHPGVKQVMDEGDTCLAGPVETITVCVDPEGPEAFLDYRSGRLTQ